MSDDSARPTDPETVPEPVVRRRRGWRFSAVWLVPLVAILVGIGLVVRTQLERGPTIHISFDSAMWLTAGKTEVRYKNVPMGQVTALRLDKNFNRVIATVELRRSAARLARADTRFWIVRPHVDLRGVSGLGTLLSGTYIGVDIGQSTQRQTNFVGLEAQPAVTSTQHGRRYRLVAQDIGSLNVGAPVYYRRFAVGRVTAEHLDPDGDAAQIDIFVRAPFDKLVKNSTRFWNASGINVSLGASGFKLDTQSIVSILMGGVAFGQQRGETDQAVAADQQAFTLYPTEAAAMAPFSGPGQTVRMRFDSSVRGLAIGAEVDFHGIDFGHVTALNLHYDPARASFYTDVDAVVFPDLLGTAEPLVEQLAKTSPVGRDRPMALLVSKGLRAQLRTANLLSGQLYVALEMMPHAKPVTLDVERNPIVIPTVPGSLEQLQEQIVQIVAKLNALPVDRIGKETLATLASTRALVDGLHTQLTPQAASTLGELQKTLAELQKTLVAAQTGLVSPQSPLQENTTQTLQQLRAMAQSLTELADFLQRHPEALIRGRPADAVPPLPEKK
ncbi:MAG TPA: MlaD family protein [Nevskiaceae bacterium]